MTVSVSIKSGDRVTPPDPRGVPCLCLPTTSGTPGTVVTLEPGDDVVSVIGPGKAAAWVLSLLSGAGARVVVSPAAATWTPLSGNLTKSGSGPDIAISNATGFNGAVDDFALKIKVTTPGALGVAAGDVYYDGSTIAESIIFPQEGAAVLRGKTDISTGAVVNGLTLDVTVDNANAMITFAADAAAPAAAGLKAATATVAAEVVLTSDDLLDAGVLELDTWARNLTFTTGGGTPANAPATVHVAGFAADGSAQEETISLSQTAGTASGTKAFRGTGLVITYAAADGTSATVSIGWGSVFGPSTPAEMVADFNAAAEDDGITVRSRIHEDGTGEYFEIYTVAAGPDEELSIDADNSTADSVLGFDSLDPSNLSATGTVATLTLPNTGAMLTFSAGTYALAEVYSKSLVGPKASLSAQIAAATAAHDHFRDHPFGFLVFGEQSSHANAATLAEQIGTNVAAWLADPDAPIFVDFIVGTAFHTASPTKSTNKTAIASNDTAFLAAIANLSPDAARNFAHDDCYVQSPAGLPFGRFRRSAALAGAIRRASLDRIAGNPGQNVIPLVLLVAADGVTEARDEADNITTHLGGLDGKAWCLKSTSTGKASVKFAPCANGAGALSRLRDPGTYAISLSLAAATFAEVELWEAQSWETDPESPKSASDEELTSRVDALHDVLMAIARPQNKPPNIGNENLGVTLSAATVLDDGDVNVGVAFNPLAVPERINIAITGTGVAITEGG